MLATIQNSAREKLPIVEVMNEVSSVATFSFLRLVMSMENHFPLGIVKHSDLTHSLFAVEKLPSSQ